ncbi:MAG: FkbM family methyltransferase [Saccharofermentans sp.]|nr:FkbM family methyltransferase [Saccharofermentans sp.]
MKDLWNYLQETTKPVVLYGTGNGADKILDELTRHGVAVQGVFASSGFVRSRSFRGFQVESYASCKERLGDMVVLMCFGSTRPEVWENIACISSEQEFYAPDVPVYGKNLFDSKFYKENADLCAQVRNLLADEKSRETFDCTVLNKLTGDLKYLYECQVEADEADSLTVPPADALYLDLGAYNGDTVLRYTSLYPSIKSVIAVEPDARNFRKLNENTTHIPGVTYVNALISDHVGETTMEVNKGRGVHEGKGVAVSCTTVDELLKDVDEPVFIKMDVEGNELAAINGGREFISKNRPVMNIACYHRSEDIWTLPLAVHSLRPDYKIYMRHLPSVPGWDTQFYFV